ncbi:unnamed protein product [Phytophthora lilii]|uniref:Unnamed protein product n=1 Tax=Phytophthora lilii TaxID=2077276 RepID=A0A9W6XCC5_9STRA|nr:unnamed protein product [Phytophthora lilii]
MPLIGRPDSSHVGGALAAARPAAPLAAAAHALAAVAALASSPGRRWVALAVRVFFPAQTVASAADASPINGVDGAAAAQGAGRVLRAHLVARVAGSRRVQAARPRAASVRRDRGAGGVAAAGAAKAAGGAARGGAALRRPGAVDAEQSAGTGVRRQVL